MYTNHQRIMPPTNDNNSWQQPAGGPTMGYPQGQHNTNINHPQQYPENVYANLGSQPPLGGPGMHHQDNPSMGYERYRPVSC